MISSLTAKWAAPPHHNPQALAMSSSPAMAPNQDVGVLFLNDRHYALHGEIMMAVLIVLFVAFVFCLAVVTRLRRDRRTAEEDSVSKKWCNCFESLCSLVRRKRNRGDDDAAAAAPEAPLRGSNDSTGKSSSSEVE